MEESDQSTNQQTDHLQFKTNINCSGCVAKVTPALNRAEGIVQWTVDTTKKEKILTIQSHGISQQQIIHLVKEAGFQISALE